MPHPEPGLRRRWLVIVAVLGLFLVAQGCAPTPHATSPEVDVRARNLVMAVRSLNADISAVKGTGTLTLFDQGRQDRFKLAFAAQPPNRLRLTLLMSARPVETVVASGDSVTFISHTGQHKPHTTRSADPDLAPYFHLPLRLSDLVSLLSGKIPLKDFDRAWFDSHDKDLVITSRHFSSHIQQLRFDGEGKVVSLALLKNHTPAYRIIYKLYTPEGHYLFPTDMTLEDNEGRTLTLSLTRILPDPPIKESVFRLTDPGL